MKRLSIVLLILVFGLTFAPPSFLIGSPGVVFAQEGEGDPVDEGLEEEDAGAQLNINTASAEQFAALDGIEDELAQNIVEYRDANGLFDSLEDLKNVTGIGDSKLEEIRESITVD